MATNQPWQAARLDPNGTNTNQNTTNRFSRCSLQIRCGGGGSKTHSFRISLGPATPPGGWGAHDAKPIGHDRLQSWKRFWGSRGGSGRRGASPKTKAAASAADGSRDMRPARLVDLDHESPQHALPPVDLAAFDRYGRGSAAVPLRLDKMHHTPGPSKSGQ